MSTPLDLQPIDGAAAWRAADFTDPLSYVMQLDPAQVAELEAIGERIAGDDPDIRTLTVGNTPLPACAPSIERWAAELDHGRGFLTVRGLDALSYRREMSAAIFYVLGLHLGVPMRQNAHGDVLTHVIATTDEPAYSGRGRTRAVHTTSELVFHSDSSDVVGLLCVRAAADGGASRLASAATIYNELLARRPDLLPLLFEPFAFDWQIQDPTAPYPTYSSPIFCFVDGVLSMYAGSTIVFTAQQYPHVSRLADAQVEALELVDAIADEPGVALDIDFQPGDIQWLLNYSTLHSRTAYRDHDDPALRRHLMRLWLRRDVGRPLADPFGKPLADLGVDEPRHPRLHQLTVVPDRVPAAS